MGDSREYCTVRNCSSELERALQEDRDIVYFLNGKGFITDNDCEELLHPKTVLTSAQKAGQLVGAIKRRVSLSRQDYHTLVEHFRQNRRMYGNILDILEREYAGQQGRMDLGVELLNL